MVYAIQKENLVVIKDEKEDYVYEYWKIQSLEGYVTNEKDIPKVLNKLNRDNKNKETIRYSVQFVEEFHSECL